jgi:hypothetical protein
MSSTDGTPLRRLVTVRMERRGSGLGEWSACAEQGHGTMGLLRHRQEGDIAGLTGVLLSPHIRMNSYRPGTDECMPSCDRRNWLALALPNEKATRAARGVSPLLDKGTATCAS